VAGIATAAGHPIVGAAPVSASEVRDSTTRMPGRAGARSARIRWLPGLVFLVNLAVLALLVGYSSLNLRPDLPQAPAGPPGISSGWTGVRPPAAATIDREGRVRRWRPGDAGVVLAVLGPTVASLVLLRPVLRWVRRSRRPGEVPGDDIPDAIALRAANAPIALALFSLLGWLVVAGLALVRPVAGAPEIAAGLRVHLVLRPILAGFIAGAATFFAAEYLCRTHVWPVLLARTRIAANPRLWRVRVSHRLTALWLAISVLPLGAVGLTTVTRVAGVDLAADPALARLVSVVLLIAASAAVGGAWLAWLVSRSVGRPLEALEAAMGRLRDGHLDTRQPVSATDEIGAVAEGFNLMAGRLSESYAALEARNRELAGALDRVLFLERVKRGLDRFVPETVRQAIEENPEAPGLGKTARDVSVLFLDIEGYSRLSEELPRATLNAIVERYFSLFLGPIRSEGGDINETAGDGLMIIFQHGGAEGHAVAAVRAARAIREQTLLANRDPGRRHPPIVVNIGISSGEVDLGTTRFQSPASERWTYTATGPVTNAAARLGARASGGQILLGPDTARRVRGRFPLRSLGPVALKNLAGPLEVWELEDGCPGC
jgi:class 3 adenylate cyclase/HAMP domain-containing protein